MNEMHDDTYDSTPVTIAGLQQRLARFAAERDWGQYHTPKNLAAALSVEAASWWRSSSG